MLAPRARTRRIISTSTAIVVALLGVTVSACNATDGPKKGSTPSATPSEGSTADAEPNPDWQTASEEGGRFSVPPDWNIEKVATGHNLQAPLESEGGFRFGGGIFTSRPTLDSATAIDDAAESRLTYDKEAGYDKVERLPDVIYGGLTFYHVRAEDPETWVDDYGTVSDGQRVSVLWNFKRGLADRAQADGMIDQVMKTFEPTP